MTSLLTNVRWALPAHFEDCLTAEYLRISAKSQTCSNCYHQLRGKYQYHPLRPQMNWHMIHISAAEHWAILCWPNSSAWVIIVSVFLSPHLPVSEIYRSQGIRVPYSLYHSGIPILFCRFLLAGLTPSVLWINLFWHPEKKQKNGIKWVAELQYHNLQ